MKTVPAVSNLPLQEKREQLIRHVCSGDWLNNKYRAVAPRIVCEDGFSVSVQTGEGTYCTPRKRADWYTAFELGYPSMEDDLIMPYADNPETPMDTVYGYVPIDCVIALLDKHGGPVKLKGTEL